MNKFDLPQAQRKLKNEKKKVIYKLLPKQLPNNPRFRAPGSISRLGDPPKWAGA